jgi:hypothetical protein
MAAKLANNAVESLAGFPVLRPNTLISPPFTPSLK